MIEPPNSGRTALYRLYDAEGTLLYIGISSKPERRWGQHAGDKKWWPEVATQQVEWFNERSEAEDAESAAIRAETPRHNARGNPAHRPDDLPRARFTWMDAAAHYWQMD